MPLLSMRNTRIGRLQVFGRAQLPLLVGALLIGGAGLVLAPETAATGLLPTGLAVIVLASIAAVAIPWENFARSWMIPIALADIVGVALMRAELVATIPAVGLLVIFPVLWLAYGFHQFVVALALAGAAFVTAFPFLLSGAWPSTPLQWVNVCALPMLVIGVAAMANIAAAQLRRNLRNLDAASEEQKIALRMALDNEILARGILDTVNAGVAFYSRDNTLQLSNELARNMVEAVGFRLDKPPYAGENVLAADRLTPIPFEEQIIPRALRGELIENHMEWLGPPEQQTAIIATSRPVHREDGALLGTVIVAYDITELASAITVREEFLGIVAHELRTPLTSVLGYLELVAEEVDPAQTEIHGYLAVIQRNMARLSDRVADLRSAEETELTLELESADLGELLDSGISRVLDQAHARDIAIAHTPSSSLTVVIDVKEMSRAIDELLANAIKFGIPSTTLTVTHDLTPTGAEFIVSNESAAMTRAEHGRVFDRFYRADNARDGAIQGFGLGLFVVKNIIEAHHGHIVMRHSSSGGTSLVVTLPSEPSAPALETAAGQIDS